MPNLPALRRPEIRALLRNLFVNTEDFDAFCIDYFPAVYQRFTRGMQRVQMENLLLDLVPEAELVEKLATFNTAQSSPALQIRQRHIPSRPKLHFCQFWKRWTSVAVLVIVFILFIVPYQRWHGRLASLINNSGSFKQEAAPDGGASLLTGRVAKANDESVVKVKPPPVITKVAARQPVPVSRGSAICDDKLCTLSGATRETLAKAIVCLDAQDNDYQRKGVQAQCIIIDETRVPHCRRVDAKRDIPLQPPVTWRVCR